MSDILLNYTLEELESAFFDLNEPKFKAKQVYKWLYLDNDFATMSDISIALREKLSSRFIARPVKILKSLSARDGTIKYLYQLHDGNVVEGVLMKYKYGNTLCVSTQVGCRMGCAFCASGIGGLERNLSAGEILGQIIAVNSANGGTVDKRVVTNVVLMGSGEPLDNYDNVVKFLRLANDEAGINISRRNISLSTCGIADRVKMLADDGLSVTLTISLHASTDEQRRKLIPYANKFSIREIMDSARYYFDKTGRRVVFEYILIEGVNHLQDDVYRLKNLLKGFPSHLNLIILNQVKEKNIKGASRAQAEHFLQLLEKEGVSATIRRSMGSDIEGACGQLRRKHIGEQ